MRSLPLLSSAAPSTFLLLLLPLLFPAQQRPAKPISLSPLQARSRRGILEERGRRSHFLASIFMPWEHFLCAAPLHLSCHPFSAANPSSLAVLVPSLPCLSPSPAPSSSPILSHSFALLSTAYDSPRGVGPLSTARARQTWLDMYICIHACIHIYVLLSCPRQRMRTRSNTTRGPKTPNIAHQATHTKHRTSKPDIH